VTAVLDFAKLYSSLNTAWDKVRVDVLSHALLLAVFFLASVTPPRVTFPVVDVDKVMNHSIYKLAKDTNALLFVPVVLSLAVIVYGLVMRTLGQALASVIIATFPPTAGKPFIAGVVRVPDLVTIASLLERSDFNEHDLSNAVSNVMLRYATKQDKDMQQFRVGQQNKDASLYLGYAILFPICWFALFLWLPSQSTWKMQNNHAFWPVLSLLLLFLLRSWIRVREFFLMLPGSLVSFMAHKIRTDPDLAAALDGAKPRLADIEARVESIRLKALLEAATPSLFGFINSRLRGIETTQHQPSRTTRIWLRRVYQEGRSFSESEKKIVYEEQWLESFAKYVFYRITHAIVRLMMLVLGLLLYLTGATEWLRRVSGRTMELSVLELGATVRRWSAVNADPEQTVSESSAAARDSD
jgi:hypothetical protein